MKLEFLENQNTDLRALKNNLALLRSKPGPVLHAIRNEVGREGNHRPFMEIKEDTSLMQYVAFNIMGSRKSAALRINLPPVRIPEKIVYLDDGIPIWVTIGNKDRNCLPTDAVIGGWWKDKLYVIRASHQGSLTPGKFVSPNGSAYISWGGEAHIKNEFEVLCGYNFKWLKTTQNRIPVNAVKGGYSEIMHEPLYVGRVEHDGCIIPGKFNVLRTGVPGIPGNGTSRATKGRLYAVPETVLQFRMPIYELSHTHPLYVPIGFLRIQRQEQGRIISHSAPHSRCYFSSQR
ncbi:hypothetical protein EVAR_25883_1 [Eumeta japonica]|uniref:Uncharacterized protein n=1 Tax=Eumeta variegata TaxID=151549 RepID=A0A4C1W1J3_EUMVA|nr:hypothetical protein EVAR_25883_1 [Eumeta japonica]